MKRVPLLALLVAAIGAPAGVSFAQPVAERPDHHCGPMFGSAPCGVGRCCSVSSWCGNQGEPHCGALRGFGGRFDGPPAAPAPREPAGQSAACITALQGRVAWDYEGSTTWAADNLQRLCASGRGAEPARCFQRVMHGGVNFGGGTRWEWANAINLCRGSRSADVTVSCFEAMVRGGSSWQNAISTCQRGGAPAVVPAQPPPDPMAECAEALQGRVAWDPSRSNTSWSPTNIERLCRGGRGAQPARCFARLMAGGVDYGGGSTWQWENAVNLCAGSSNAGATIACFQGRISAGQSWQQAIPACNH